MSTELSAKSMNLVKRLERFTDHYENSLLTCCKESSSGIISPEVVSENLSKLNRDSQKLLEAIQLLRGKDKYAGAKPTLDSLVKRMERVIAQSGVFTKGSDSGAGEAESSGPDAPKPGAAGGGGKKGGKPDIDPKSASMHSVFSKAKKGYETADKASGIAAPKGIANAGATCFLNAAAQLLLHSFHGRLHTLPETHFRNVLMAMERGLVCKGSSSFNTSVTNSLRQAIYLDGMTAVAPKGGSTYAGACAARYTQCDSRRVIDHVLHDYLLEKPIAIQGTKKTNSEGEIAKDAHGNDIIDLEEIRSPHCNLHITDANITVPTIEEMILENNPDRYPTREFLSAPQDLFVSVNYSTLSPTAPAMPLFAEYTVGGSENHYALDSFTLHIGSSEHAGHYVAYIRKAGDWFLVNDSSTTKVSLEHVQEALQPSAVSRPVTVHYSNVLTIDS